MDNNELVFVKTRYYEDISKIEFEIVIVVANWRVGLRKALVSP